MKRTTLLFVALAAIVVMTGTAMADPVTFTQGSFTATLNIVGNTATLTFGSGLNGFFTDQIAIHIANDATVNPALSSASSGTWLFQSGDNSVNCDGAGNWFCAVAGSNVSFNGLTLTWNFTGGTVIDPVSVQFAVCNSASGDCAPGAVGLFVTNFSQSAIVPEPSSLALLATGVLGLGLFRRRL